MTESKPATETTTEPAAPAAAQPTAPAAGTEAAPEPGPAAEAAAPEAATAPAAPASTATSRTTDIVAGQGGVMTDEVGVITGEVTLLTELAGDQVTIRAQYKDADEWYTVTGAKTTVKDPADLDAVHAIAVGLLNRPEG
ncbi:hypothetical protein [Actinoplanes auranticolor]|uniref:Uncharacterized protein n=1 Tax=Actinoplanes auranticolor TaxID=47988 RepID=A0A919S7E4_9ACTN|nr:hypothetical protein [Actinoplanes auranticolor]GIM65484.1 hypothetical protein Aau02nite_17430 [Actinoplanes auranticolor]